MLPSKHRPPRRHIPIAIKRAVLERQNGYCVCGCGEPVGPGCPTHYDHEPALRLRDVAPDGRDYVPAQLDPKYIDARCPASHKAKTSGSGATTAGTDIGKIKKERRRSRTSKPKRSWPKGRKMQSRPWEKKA